MRDILATRIPLRSATRDKLVALPPTRHREGAHSFRYDWQPFLRNHFKYLRWALGTTRPKPPDPTPKMLHIIKRFRNDTDPLSV